MTRRREMAVLRGFLVFLVCFLVIGESDGAGSGSLNRSSLPPSFIFGTASAAYQYEGTAAEGGRGPSIWDTFTSTYPEKIKDRSDGSVATDSYHRYKEDVKLMKELGMDSYRFSISWTRILPNGSLSGGVNKEGVAFYNRLIDELISKGIKPFVTLFHWDSPQGLEDLYGGFLSRQIIPDFVDFAEICFKEFGDRVKNWITFNEPWAFTVQGYSRGVLAPGRCSPWEDGKCQTGDSTREPYTVGHYQLLAHAKAVKLYREKYQAASVWLFVYPKGIRELLLYIRDKYNNPVIYITENGVDEANDESLTLEQALKDDFRISFYEKHLLQVRRAISKGVDVRGFFAWSLLDNFKWGDGYTVRFGIYYVDFKNGLKRFPKTSALWFRRFLRTSGH